MNPANEDQAIAPDMVGDVHDSIRAIQWLDDPTFGDVQTQGVPFLLSETPGRIKNVFKPVGADNEHLLAKLCGFTGSQIAELEKKEII